jgi:hypothetical protein
LAGASHQSEPCRVLQPIERDENLQRPGDNRYQDATIVEVMEVPSGQNGWSSRGQMLQTLDVQVDSARGELAYRADGAVRQPGR